MKRIGLHMRLFAFKERLKYKCNVNRCKYEEIDESYTSKTCTKCGELNQKLGRNKIFSWPQRAKKARIKQPF